MPAYKVFFTITFSPVGDDSTEEPITHQGDLTSPVDISSGEDAAKWLTELFMEGPSGCSGHEASLVDSGDHPHSQSTFWNWKDGFDTTLDITGTKLVE